MDKQTIVSQSLFSQVRHPSPFRGIPQESSMDKQTAAQLIHDRALALVLDARRWPQTKQVAHAYVCRALKWAAIHNQRQLAEKLSGFSLTIGELR